MKRVTYIWIAGVILAGTMASYASAQDSTAPTQSLGDYARAQRKDKKTAPTKQFDNDNLPMDDKLSVVGGSASTGSDTSQTAANGGADADKKADPNSPTYSLEFLRDHPEVSTESVPWHMHKDVSIDLAGIPTKPSSSGTGKP